MPVDELLTVDWICLVIISNSQSHTSTHQFQELFGGLF